MCVYVCLVSGDWEPSVTYWGTSSREWRAPHPQGHGEWRVCWKRWIPAGQFPWVSLAQGGSFPRCQTEAPETNKWQAVGGTSDRELCGLTASKLALATALFPALFWKGIMWLLALGNYHLWTLFFSCVILEKDTHKPCIRTVHSGITGMSQSSFKNDVAI